MSEMMREDVRRCERSNFKYVVSKIPLCSCYDTMLSLNGPSLVIKWPDSQLFGLKQLRRDLQLWAFNLGLQIKAITPFTVQNSEL